MTASRRTALVLVALTVAVSAHGVTAQQGSPSALLRPTQHPPLPAQLSQYWLIPETATGRTPIPSRDEPMVRLARGAKLAVEGDFAAALPLVSSPALGTTPLADYAQYYRGVALHGLSRLPEADAVLSALAARAPQGQLGELVAARLAEVALARDDAERAKRLLADLLDAAPSAPADVLARLAGAEESAGHAAHAVDAYRRLYYDFPTSAQATDAQTGLKRLSALAPAADRLARELARAEALFSARRWAEARAAFAPLVSLAAGEQKALVTLRLAESDYYLNRYRASRDALRPFLEGGPREAEARYFHLSAIRGLGDRTTYERLARGLVADYPQSEWSAEALDDLASHYIRLDEDPNADAVFRELLERFPRHRHAERAAWRAGWWAYRQGRFAETADIFETAAATFPRADYRPAWLYWAGRSRDRLGDEAEATRRFQLVRVDYQNTYYGRLASARLTARTAAPLLTLAADTPQVTVPAPPRIPTEPVIRALLTAQMYGEALAEVQYAQRVWGDAPQLQATTAWIRHQQGLSLTATERFNALRGAINTMRRAYPQFMTAGGEQLPADVLRIIFPLDFWPLITKYAGEHALDPYVMAALMAQESTFTPEIRSHANAYGLLQLVPATGRQVARSLGLRYTRAMLTKPEPNVRLGMKYFKGMVDQFGGVHFALAGYNAGPHRVKRWLAEEPDLPQDEFIDNIPYPETQTYVKRILGTAEDYRRLYGPGGQLDPDVRMAASAEAPAPAPKTRTTRPRRR